MKVGRLDHSTGNTKQSPGQQRTGSCRSRSRSSRLWQLPEESIKGYAQWIQDKPESDQTPAERRFLWKYMMRYFSVRQSHDSTRNFVEKLETKSNRTALEDAFIKQYHRRRKERRNERMCVLPAAVVSDEAVIVWERPPNDPPKKKGVSFLSPSTPVSANTSVSGPTMSLSGLQESMEKLGISLANLKEQNLQDDASMELSV